MTTKPYSYRDDPDVPDFDDSRPLFVFDHYCVLCSGGASFIMKRKTGHRIAFTSAQEPLGEALCDHYDIDWDESYRFIRRGKPFIKSDGYFEVAKELGGILQLALIFKIIPRPIRDWAYDLVARNRYKWFGKTETACELLTKEQQSQLVSARTA